MQILFRRFNIYITLSLVFSVTSSLSILSCVFSVANEVIKQTITTVFALIFWIGLVFEQVFIWKANFIRKHQERTNIKRRIQLKPGVISFFQTEAGTIADHVFIISLVLYIILAAINVREMAVQYLCIFLLVLSFRLHCILNGKNFRYKKFLVKRKVDKNGKFET